MDIFALYDQKQQALLAELSAKGDLPALDTLPLDKLGFEPPRDPAHGDLASNAALVLAKPLGLKPRDLAETLAGHMRAWPDVAAVDIAGPGFLNLRLDPGLWPRLIQAVRTLGKAYGRGELGAGQPLNVEYVSANPTGPLHLGHARGAAVGDVVANLLDFQGFRVTREFYINDAGSQVDTLARSAYLRYREAFGEAIEIPSGLYPGDYLKAVGEALKAEFGAQWLVDAPEEAWLAPIRNFAIAQLMDWVRKDLLAFGVAHDRFSSERELAESGRAQAALQTLRDQGLVYEGTLPAPKGKPDEDWEPRTQLLFRASDFGDTQDRPLYKSDGTATYFANDVAYHADKWQRTHGPLINVWGEDHKGYVKRMQAATRALTGGAAQLEVLITSIVSVVKDGEPVKLSKRAGNLILISDMIDWVGKDAFRYSLLTRKSTETLEIDIELVRAQARENPLFYVQYAHARACSVLREGAKVLSQAPDSVSFSDINPAWSRFGASDWALAKQLANWPRVARGAALSREPQRLPTYLAELAAAFHAHWTQGREQAGMRFIVEDDFELTAARLHLVEAVAITIKQVLSLLGVEALEELS